MVPLTATNIILTLTRIDSIKIDRKLVQTLFVYFAMLFHQFNYDLANVFASFYFSLQYGYNIDLISVIIQLLTLFALVYKITGHDIWSNHGALEGSEMRSAYNRKKLKMID